MAVTPQPFSLHVPQADIDDLRVRLAKTRYPDQAPDAPWAFGTDVDYLRVSSTTGAPRSTGAHKKRG